MSIQKLTQNTVDALFPKADSPIYNLLKTRVNTELQSKIVNGASDMAQISKNSQKAGNIYNEIKKTGNKEAASAFRTSLVSYVSKGDVSGMNNLMKFGTSLVENKKTSMLNDSLTVAEGLNKSGATGVAQRFLSTAATTYNNYGEGSLKDLNSAAGYLSRIGSSEGTKSGGLASAQSSLSEAFSRIQNLNVTDQEKKNQMGELSKGVQNTKSIEEANSYLKDKLSQIGEAEKTQKAA